MPLNTKFCGQHEICGFQSTCEACWWANGRSMPEKQADGFYATEPKACVELTVLCRKTQRYDHHDAGPIEVQVVKATRDLKEIQDWLAQNVGYTGWRYFTKQLLIEKELLDAL